MAEERPRTARQQEADRRRLTTRWHAEHYNVVADEDDPGQARHVATTTSASVAAHIAELHNRTMGEGQEPPLQPVRGAVGVEDIEPRLDETVTLDPTEVLNDSVDAVVWAREFMKRFQGTQADEGTMLSWFANAIENGKRSVANVGVKLPWMDGLREYRAHLDDAEWTRLHNEGLRFRAEREGNWNPPRDTRLDDRNTVKVVVELDSKQIRRIVQNEVARHAGDGGVWEPERMIERLRALGYAVFPPGRPGRLQEDLTQDLAEGVPSARGAIAYLNDLPASWGYLDALRKAFHAGYREATDRTSVPVFKFPENDVQGAINVLRKLGFQITGPTPAVIDEVARQAHERMQDDGPVPDPRDTGSGWNCGVLHNAEGHTHLTREGAEACIEEQTPVEVNADPGLSQVVEQP